MNRYPSKEYQLIEKIDKNCSRSINQWFTKSIGDDCAVRKAGSDDLLFSADTLVEGIHFSLGFMTLKEVGYKSAMVNISDIAAMGGVPDSMLIQLVFPEGATEEQVAELYEGLGDAVEEFRCPIVGGDLSKGPCWMIAVTITGLSNGRVLFRNEAKVGDSIWVTGTPGLSAIGLEKLFAGENRRDENSISKHIRPTPRVQIGQQLASDNSVHAMLDISDGVAKEALTVAKDSGVAMELFIPQAVKSTLMDCKPQKTPSHYFLHGGEDYELLITASQDFSPSRDIEIYKIGEVVAGNQVYFSENGSRTKLLSGGWDHF